MQKIPSDESNLFFNAVINPLANEDFYIAVPIIVSNKGDAPLVMIASKLEDKILETEEALECVVSAMWQLIDQLRDLHNQHNQHPPKDS